ncbi:MAG: energy-coupling factor ABC transporter ATP-binding protein [Canibacter sp.]
MITFDQVSVVAGDRTILHPFTLTLTEPVISVVGANGSGKSTFARLINGLVTPMNGVVRLGEAPRQLDTVREGAAVRQRVGFVFTDANAQLIMPTALEDISLSLRKSHRSRTEREQAARNHLKNVGLAHLAEQSIHALSGGQKQLLALTSVLATDPDILVADEPTTLLDLRNAKLISDRLCALTQQVVIVTHDLELAARAHRTLVLEEGRIVWDGAPNEAIAHYRKLVEAL